MPAVSPLSTGLFDSHVRRARTLMAEGLTTLEVKSGYGLSLEHEARCLRVARRLGRELALEVRTTCLAAHALPPEYEGRADDYVDAVCAWLNPTVRIVIIEMERRRVTPASDHSFATSR